MALAVVLAGSLRAAGVPGAPDHPPAQAVTVDVTDGATLIDWLAVLAHPGNAVRDERGGAGACPGDDLDCTRGALAAEDLRRFAWTHDDTNLYFYLERQDESATTGNVFIFVDEDQDGRMQADERVLWIEWLATRTLRVKLVDYQVSAGPGDPLVGPGGGHDGHAMAGRVINLNLPDPIGEPPDCVGCASVDGRVAELRVPWAALTTISAPQGVGFHVSSTFALGGETVIDSSFVRDNLGLSGVTHGASVLPASGHVAVGPGATAEVAVPLAQLGNAIDGARTGERLNLEVQSERGLSVELWRDSVGGTLLGRDANGDGDFADTDDAVLVDGDGDGRPDTGVTVRIGESRTVIAVLEVPDGAAGFVDRLEVRALPEGAPSGRERGVVPVHAGPVTLATDSRAAGAPNDVAWHRLELAEHAGTAQRVDFDITTSFVAMLHEDAGDGSPAAALVDGDGDGLRDVWLDAGEVRPLVLVVDVPMGAAPGLDADRAVVTAIPEATPEASASVEAWTEVLDPLTLRRTRQPPVAIPVHRALPGTRLWFPHQLLNATPTDVNAFLVGRVILGDVSLPEFFSDPNGDGNPDDGELLDGASPIPLAGNGGCFSFVAVTTVGTSAAGLLSIGIDALTDLGGMAATEELAQVVDGILHRSSVHEVPVLATGPCAVASVEIRGVQGDAVTFTWDDGTGTVRTDGSVVDEWRTARDARAHAAGDAIGVWTVATAGTTTEFVHESAVEMAPPAVQVSADEAVLLVAQVVRSLHESAEVRGAWIESWVLTDGEVPDVAGGEVLLSSGLAAGLAPHDGAAGPRTRTRPLAPLAPGADFVDRFGVRGIAWSSGGSFRVHSRVLSECGGVLAEVASEPFVITALPVDTDGDTVPDDVDNCPTVANGGQADRDDDLVGDACDGCPDDPNPGQEDDDGDGTQEACDNCPGLANAGQADRDTDGVGDDCDGCPDDPNPMQLDGDGDTVQDACDNCPGAANADQMNRDGDPRGDVCDPCPDDPADGCVAVDLLRNAELTSRDATLLDMVLTAGRDPRLDVPDDVLQAGVGGMPDVTILGDGRPVGAGQPGVLIFYEVTNRPGPIRVRRSGDDVVVSGW